MAVADLLAWRRLGCRYATPGDRAVVHHGFTFATADARSISPLRVADPKEWTEAEINLVKKAIDEIIDRPEGKDIAAALNQEISVSSGATHLV